MNVTTRDYGSSRTPTAPRGTKISACLIVRDEAATIGACLASIRPWVDEIVAVDTGSGDETGALVSDLADVLETWTGCNDELGRIVDFAAARNHAGALASGDWLLWLDGDDVLVGGEHLRELVSVPDESGSDCDVVVLPYEYQHDEQGRCTVLQYRERLMYPLRSFRWQCPVHEGCLPARPGVSLRTRTDERVRLVHRHPASKPREVGRNLRILESYVAQMGEGDPRAMFYLGLERRAAGRFDDALAILTRYVELSSWSDERCLAMLELSALHANASAYETAIDWALRASQEKSWPAPYWAIGRAYYSLAATGVDPARNFRRAAHHLQLGLSLVEHAPTVLLQSPLERYDIERWLNVCLSAIGDHEGAAASCRRGLVGLAGEPSLAKNLVEHEKHAKRARVVCLSRELTRDGHLSPEALALIETTISGAARVSLSPVCEKDPSPPPSRTLPRRVPAPGYLDIVIYVGHGLERWTPSTLERTGMGGSETMAWLVARELARRGHAVRVFADCMPYDEGDFEGVEWFNSSKFVDETCDVLITSRRPEAIDASVKARARILWVHDVHCGPVLTPERAQRLDRIWCLTEWHSDVFRRTYPYLQADKVRTIRNAIDLDLWSDRGESLRDPHRAVYSSSPDRGLWLAVQLWPRVREQVPDAELHAFYGFDNWRKCASGTDVKRDIDELERACDETPGVFMHGRVSERELRDEYFRSGVWAYPTWWVETSCISAMQAHAAGLVLVTSDLAGLHDTAHKYAAKITEPYASPEYCDKWVAAVVDGMRNPGTARVCGPEFARERFGLPGLIDMMEEQMRELVAAPVVPAFSEVGL